MLDLNAAFAWALSREFVLGTSFSGQFYYGGGHGYTTGPWPASVTGGGYWGLLFAWMPDSDEPPVSVEVSAGFAGGGNAQWGGFGPYVAPAFTVFFAHGRNHFGLTVRIQYEPMFSDYETAHGAQKNYVSGLLAIGWTFF